MSERKIDRRHALSMLGIGMGAAVLASCGNDGTPAAPATTGAATSAATTTTNTATTGAATSAATTTTPAVATGLSPARFGNAASCALTTEQTEGPYYIDVDKIRSDIREDRQGVPLRVAVRVLDSDGCTPIKDALFEIWHCDAGGVYSGFEAAGGDARFLRGAQVTNADGIAEITTIYPGYYQGRTVHIHAKIFVSNTEVLTAQLYFEDTLSDTVYQNAPYSAQGTRSTRNANDGIFSSDGLLTIEKDGDGYLGLLKVTVAA